MTHKPLDFAFVLFCDGGCNNHTHANGYGSYAVLKRGEEVARQTRREYAEVETSQEAEYQALLDALRWIASYYQPSVNYRVWSDSRLVVNQASGYWRCQAANLWDYYVKVDNLLREMPNVKIAWTPRGEIVKVLGH